MAFSPDAMKVIALVLMILVAIIGVIIVPWFLKKRALEFIFGQAMAAGVLLVAAFLHLLPEAVEFVPKPQRLTAGAICISTFLLLVLIESIAVHIWSKPEADNTPTSGSPTADDKKKQFLQSNASAKNGKEQEAESMGVGALCLFVALSVHSIIEGFALGAQDNIQNMTTTLISIVAHKGLAGLALGQTLLKANYRVRTFLCMGIAFSLFSPIGLVIGWALQWSSCHPGVGVANAMAAGTFVFTGAYEILPHLFEKRGKILQKSLGLLVGVCLLILLIVVLEGGGHAHNCPGHDHGHEDDDDPGHGTSGALDDHGHGTNGTLDDHGHGTNGTIDDHGHGTNGTLDDHGHGTNGTHDDDGHGTNDTHDDHGHGTNGTDDTHDDHGHGTNGTDDAHDDHGHGTKRALRNHDEHAEHNSRLLQREHNHTGHDHSEKPQDGHDGHDHDHEEEEKHDTGEKHDEHDDHDHDHKEEDKHDMGEKHDEHDEHEEHHDHDHDHKEEDKHDKGEKHDEHDEHEEHHDHGHDHKEEDKHDKGEKHDEHHDHDHDHKEEDKHDMGEKHDEHEEHHDHDHDHKEEDKHDNGAKHDEHDDHDHGHEEEDKQDKGEKHAEHDDHDQEDGEKHDHGEHDEHDDHDHEEEEKHDHDEHGEHEERRSSATERNNLCRASLIGTIVGTVLLNSLIAGCIGFCCLMKHRKYAASCAPCREDSQMDPTSSSEIKRETPGVDESIRMLRERRLAEAKTSAKEEVEKRDLPRIESPNRANDLKRITNGEGGLEKGKGKRNKGSPTKR